MAGAGTAALFYAHYVERVQVELSRYTVTTDAEGLPPGGVTILHLSDFHFREDDAVQERKIARLLELLEPEQYDIVALTGDLVHDAGGFPTALRLIRQLQPRLGAFSVPGNHDYAEYSVWGVFDQTWQESGGATLSISRSCANRPAGSRTSSAKCCAMIWCVYRSPPTTCPRCTGSCTRSGSNRW